jgi:hypothetical protein
MSTSWQGMGHAARLSAILLGCLSMMLAPASARAQAGPPLITDDPGTPGDGKWEINVAFTTERSHDRTVFEAPLLDINYGVGERTQLKYEVPLLVLDERGRGPRADLGDSSLGVKYRFLDQEQAGVDVSVYPQVSINSPTRSVQRGFVDRGTNVFLPVEVARSFGPWEIGAEVGYEVIQHGENQWAYGVAAGYAFNNDFELLGEIHGERGNDFRHGEEVVFNLGTRWKVHEGMTLLFAAGRSLRDGAGGEHPDLLVYTGLSFEF